LIINAPWQKRGEKRRKGLRKKESATVDHFDEAEVAPGPELTTSATRMNLLPGSRDAKAKGDRDCPALIFPLQFFMPEKRDHSKKQLPKPRPKPERWRRIDESTKHEGPKPHGVSDTLKPPPRRDQPPSEKS